jgi:hypothetical protein
VNDGDSDLKSVLMQEDAAKRVNKKPPQSVKVIQDNETLTKD